MGATNATRSHSSSVERFLHRLENKWNSVQVARQGSYSVERLESLDHYCKSTSSTRVFLVCILTPLPALAAAILLECIPLRPPSEGWAANWALWIRLYLTTFIMNGMGMVQLITLVPDINPTILKILLVAGCSSLAYTVTCIGGAKVVGFPIPMMWYFGGFLMGTTFPPVMVLIFGWKQFTKRAPCHRNLQRFTKYIGASIMLINVFPLCKVLYGHLPASVRLVVVIVLPVWTFAAKHFLVKFTLELEDFLPGIVAMVVDFFSSLFISVCMSTSGSFSLSAAFMAGDVAQLLLEVREIRENASVASNLLHSQRRSADGSSLRLLSSKSCLTRSYPSSNLMALILQVTRDPRAFGVTSLKGVRLRACYPHPVSDEQAEILKALEASQHYDCNASSTINVKPFLQDKKPHRWATIAVKPLTKSDNQANGPSLGDKVNHQQAAASGERSRKLVVQGLQLLFHCEYVLLVEYVECLVPLVFTIHKAILEHLPNAIYYPNGAGHFGPEVAANILVLALLQMVSLFLLHIFLQRQFAFSPLYQIAFVLETQFYMVQANMFIMAMFLLQYEIKHYGTDFTFQFEWLHKPT